MCGWINDLSVNVVDPRNCSESLTFDSLPGHEVTENGQERYASRCELRSVNGYVHLEAPETQSSE